MAATEPASSGQTSRETTASRAAGGEDALARLERRVAALEARLAAVEAGAVGPAAAAAPDGAAEALVLPEVPESATLLGLAGRAFLILGGAFLIRALTDAGTLPAAAGIALGGVYALVWAALADRAGARGARLEACVLALLAVLIANPLAWEAVARFRVLAPAPALALVVALAGALLVVAERRDLHALAWLAPLAAAATVVALIAATHALFAAAIALLALGLATAWLAYAPHGWRGVRWPLALVADGAVLLAVLLITRAGGPPASYTDLSRAGAWVLALALVAGYLGTFTVRTLVRRREIASFVFVQGSLAAAIGMGGAVAVARAAGAGLMQTGVVAVVFALASYGAAFALLERGTDLRKSFRFTTTLALVLLLWGTALFCAGLPLAALWGALAVAAAALGARYGRFTLRAHAALAALAAAVAGGVPAAVAAAFLRGPEALAGAAAPAALVAGAAALAVYLLVARAAGAEDSWGRLPALAAALVWLAVAAVVLVVAAGGALGAGADPARLALARTAVLAVAAVALAAVRRARWFLPLAGAAGVVLALAALKIVAEDLPHGRPATLTAGFALFGLALLAVARLGRRAAPDA